MQMKKKPSPRRHEPDDELALKRMYADYSEENAKDLEREGIGNW